MTRNKTRNIILSIAAIILMAIGTYFLSRSRSFQVLGEIYPRINTTNKVVALTFDDGPSGKVDSILSILKAQNIKATFFLTGNSIQNKFSETNKIALAGHEIGNHSYSHNRLILKSYDSIRGEIEKTDSLIRKAGYLHDIHFRPPYGKKLFVLPYYLKRNNRKTIMWDVEPESIPGIANDSEKLAEYVIKNSKSGSIILMHVMFKRREKSVGALNKIISGLKNKGYEFKTVSELLEYENT